jgi:hypothetical protein
LFLRFIGSSGASRVTRRGEFSPIGWLFSLGSFWKLRLQPKFLGYFFPQLRWCINFVKKWVGLHFGQFFSHKLIRSPWTRASLWGSVLRQSSARPGLPDLSQHIIPNRGKMYQITTKLPNDHNIYQMAVLYSKWA